MYGRWYSLYIRFFFLCLFLSFFVQHPRHDFFTRVSRTTTITNIWRKTFLNPLLSADLKRRFKSRCVRKRKSINTQLNLHLCSRWSIYNPFYNRLLCGSRENVTISVEPPTIIFLPFVFNRKENKIRCVKYLFRGAADSTCMRERKPSTLLILIDSLIYFICMLRSYLLQILF